MQLKSKNGPSVIQLILTSESRKLAKISADDSQKRSLKWFESNNKKGFDAI